MTNKQTKIESTASTIVVRYDKKFPMVSMDRRNASSLFTPNKYVFPGGKVDLNDSKIRLANGINGNCRTNLDCATNPKLISTLFAAAIRELF